MIKKFCKYYRPHWKLFLFDMICALLSAGCAMVFPIITQDIMNDYVPNEQWRQFLFAIIFLLGIYIFKAILTYIIQYWGHIVGVRIQGDMRRELFEHLQTLPFAFFDENKTGTIMSRIVNDLQDISELAHHGPEDIFISLISLGGAFVLMVSKIDYRLALIVLLIVPLIVFFAIMRRKAMRKAFRKTREEMAEINASVESSIAGIRVAKAYTASHYEIEKFDYANEKLKVARSHAYKQMGIFGSGMGFFNDFLYLVAIAAGGFFLFKRYIDAGQFTAYILYVNLIISPIRTLVAIFEQIQNGMTGFVRFQEILAVEPEPESQTVQHIDGINSNISFNNVSFNYSGNDEDEEKLVLNHISFKIEKGTTVALVGPSGGGKTTICHLIPRFYEILDGSITIDGEDIRNISRYSLRKNIGIVAQDVFLFAGSIKENIAYGDLSATNEQIVEAAIKANIHDFILSLEEGYDTYVGERGVKLSGGQKQRISIARAFLKNPPILILDEATSALDNVTEMQIQSALEELSTGRTTIVVAHRLSTVKNADEIIVITANGIEEQGSHEELIAANGIYANLYQYQFKNM